MARALHRLADRVAPHISGVPVAAAVFQPNVVRTTSGGLIALIALPFDWRRQDKAILDSDGLAPTTLLVVTAHELYAFDAGLLAWNVVRTIARWPRADLIACAIPLPGPYPPRWTTIGRGRLYPSLRLANRAGERLAELRAVGWGTQAKRVFAELTGFAGWPDGEQR